MLTKIMLGFIIISIIPYRIEIAKINNKQQYTLEYCISHFQKIILTLSSDYSKFK